MCIEAYAAGLLDGDGCIYVNRKHRPYQLQVIFEMTDYDPLAQLASQWGGYARLIKKRTSKGRSIYNWSVTGTFALVFLRDIEPWVVGKALQLRVALTYPAQGYPGALALSEEVVAARQDIGKKLHDLKQV